MMIMKKEMVVVMISWVCVQEKSALLINPKEIAFTDPPEVLGRGSFGLVLKATYALRVPR